MERPMVAECADLPADCTERVGGDGGSTLLKTRPPAHAVLSSPGRLVPAAPFERPSAP